MSVYSTRSPRQVHACEASRSAHYAVASQTHLAWRAGAICWHIYAGRHWYPDGGTLGYQLPLHRDATGGGEEPFCVRSFDLEKAKNKKRKAKK